MPPVDPAAPPPVFVGVRAFADDQNTRSHRHYRIVNEVPTVLMVVIVILVVIKPF